MNKLTTLLITGLAGALALTGAACSSSNQSGTGGMTGTDGGGSGNTYPLASTSTGFVSDPVTGVIGAWFAYGDSVG
jgi:hypothetical protein